MSVMIALLLLTLAVWFEIGAVLEELHLPLRGGR